MPGLVAGGDLEAGGADGGDLVDVEAVDASERRRARAEGREQGVDGGAFALDVDANAVGTVANAAPEPEPDGGLVNEGPDADSLHHAARGDEPPDDAHGRPDRMATLTSAPTRW
jgi:hypothetical protein